MPTGGQLQCSSLHFRFTKALGFWNLFFYFMMMYATVNIHAKRLGKHGDILLEFLFIGLLESPVYYSLSLLLLLLL